MTPYNQACPRCNAPPGYACITSKGHIRQNPHSARDLRDNPRDQQFPELEQRTGKWVRMVSKTTGEPADDLRPIAKRYDDLRPKIKKKLGRAPDIFDYKTGYELHTLLEDAGPSRRVQAEQVEAAKADADVVYDSPNWRVVMPHSMEASIAYGRGTTWCTAYTTGGNLFYSYCARHKNPVILYYALHKDGNTKLSLGYVDGKLDLTGRNGGYTVDAQNKGQTAETLQRHFGAEYLPIVQATQAHVTALGGVHPARTHLVKLLDKPAQLGAFLLRFAHRPQPGQDWYQSLEAFADNLRMMVTHPQYQGVSFAGADLHGYQFDQLQFIKADFSGANLEGASFVGCWLRVINFSDAVLTRARLENVDASGGAEGLTRFDRADLREASLLGGFRSTSFVDAKLMGANIGLCDFGPQAHRAGAGLPSSFVRADFRQAVFGNPDQSWGRINFQSADLTDADFTGAVVHIPFDLNGAVLVGTRGLSAVPQYQPAARSK